MLRAKVTEVGFEILERDEIDYEIKIVNLQKMAEREKVDTLSKIREDFSEYVFHTEESFNFQTRLLSIYFIGNIVHTPYCRDCFIEYLLMQFYGFSCISDFRSQGIGYL